MATGDELIQALQPDANTHTLTLQGRTTGGQTPEIIASYVTGKTADAMTAARRSALASADATANLNDATYTGNLIDIGHSLHICVSTRFSVVSTSCTIFLAFYDEANTLLGISRDYYFTGDALFKDGASGKFLSVGEIIDRCAAAKVYPVLRVAPSSGTVDIHIEVL